MVGTLSGLYGIAKVMNTLADKANDFVEYAEISNEILKTIKKSQWTRLHGYICHILDIPNAAVQILWRRQG